MSNKELSRDRKIVLKKLSKLEEASTDQIYEKEPIGEVFSSSKSLSNALRKMADPNKSNLLEREKTGRVYTYRLSSKGENKLKQIKKRERNRKTETEDIFEYEDGIDEFVKYFEHEDYGYSEVKKAGLGRRYVHLDYSKLEKFNVELADDLITDPDRVINACTEAVNSLPEVKEEIDIRVKNVTDIETQSISELSAKDLNSLVSVEGVVQSVSRPGAMLVSAIFECAQCGDRYEKKQDGGKLKSPYKCDCGCRKFSCLRKNQKTVLFVRIKEKPSKRSRNKTVAILEGDLAEDERRIQEAIGSGIRVIGYLETYKKSKRDNHFDFRLKCNNIEIEESKWELEEIADDEIEKIKNISERDDVFEYLSRSLAYEEIKNAEMLKKTSLLWLLGRTRNFGNLHVLCVGDPGTAKSHLATYISENFGKVIKSVATGATKVGLTASVIKDEVTGEFTAEGGSLPMADDGFHITDEVDELKDEHYSAFNEALSDGSISLAKADIHAEISADVAEFSIGNPESYSFDPHEPLYTQIPIDKDDLISRYGLILGIRANSNDSAESVEKEREKIRHILNRGDSSNFEDDEYVEPELLQKYIYYAQRTYPVLNKKSKQKIEDAYIALFGSQDDEQNFVKARHGNALATLSLAFAKMDLSNEVKSEHVQRASEFFGRCYRSIGFEIGEDDIADLTAQNTRQKKIVTDYIRNNSDKEIQVQEIVDGVDLPENNAEKIIQKMKSEGELWEPKSGYVQTV
jgi:DNA replicative helicase MCM subunit Mcm2 (Cdc46/Mcm family)